MTNAIQYGQTYNVNTAAVADMSGAFNLTPDALMAYCQSRLQGLDSQVNEYFLKQQHNSQATSALNRLQEKLSELGGDGMDGIHGDDTINRDQVAKLFDDAIRDIPPGPEKDRLLQEKAAYDGTMGKDDNILGHDEARQFAERLGTIAKDLSSSAELDMIKLQSLMTQRQTAIQMCTNMVQSLNESTKTIAQKIGA